MPDSANVTLLTPAEAPAVEDPQQEVNRALDNLLGDKVFEDFAGIKSVAIAISDKTRPVPHKNLLPPLLERLENLGLASESITLLIATGAHPPMPPEEFEWVVPADILARYPVICHDAYRQEDLVHLGQTERGSPMWINKHFARADLRVVVGNIEPHQFMGFSGGVKSAVIGLGGAETINKNHTLMGHPHSQLGRFDDNPARQDVEEMGRLADIHFALNAILNDHKQIVKVIAGEPIAVMKAGIPQVRGLYQAPVPGLFDLMIVSPGGHPKDINIYQTQKGLAHAALVTKEGGIIVLAAACPEGSGSAKYEQWMKGKTSFQDVIESFHQEGFRVGPHKAFQVARDASKARVLLVSEMSDDFVRGLLLTPISSLDDALSQTVTTLPPDACIGIMPYANATIPMISKRL